MGSQRETNDCQVRPINNLSQKLCLKCFFPTCFSLLNFFCFVENELFFINSHKNILLLKKRESVRECRVQNIQKGNISWLLPPTIKIFVPPHFGVLAEGHVKRKVEITFALHSKQQGIMGERVFPPPLCTKTKIAKS